MKTETIIHELAIRYFEGQISKAEEKLLFNYIEQAEENRLRFRQWEKEWKVTNEGDEQTMQEWQRLQRRLRTQEAIMPMLSRRNFSFWRGAAAVAAIVVLTAGLRWAFGTLLPYLLPKIISYSKLPTEKRAR